MEAVGQTAASRRLFSAVGPLASHPSRVTIRDATMPRDEYERHLRRLEEQLRADIELLQASYRYKKTGLNPTA